MTPHTPHAGTKGRAMFRTKDFFLAAFLQARGHRLVDVEDRGIFGFEASEGLGDDLLRWANNDPVSIRVPAYVNAIRNLKALQSF